MSTVRNVIKTAIEAGLRAKFSPSHLEIVNISHTHQVPENSETHFQIMLVSPEFEGLSLVARQRQVNMALADAYAQGLYSVSLTTKTDAEWDASKESTTIPAKRGQTKF